MNGYSYYSDWSLVKEILKAEEGALQWLGSLSREEQLETVKDVKMLCGLRQIPNLGPRGALELVWKVRRFQVEGRKDERGCRWQGSKKGVVTLSNRP